MRSELKGLTEDLTKRVAIKVVRSLGLELVEPSWTNRNIMDVYKDGRYALSLHYAAYWDGSTTGPVAVNEAIDLKGLERVVGVYGAMANAKGIPTNFNFVNLTGTKRVQGGEPLYLKSIKDESIEYFKNIIKEIVE